MQYAMMSKAYGREFTPKRSTRSNNPKVAAMEDEIAKEFAEAEKRVETGHKADMAAEEKKVEFPVKD
jgi:hypothetical protein